VALGVALPFVDLAQRAIAVARVRAPAAGRFLVVWGIHIGSYLGAFAGGIVAVVLVVVRRRRSAGRVGSDVQSGLCHGSLGHWTPPP